MMGWISKDAAGVMKGSTEGQVLQHLYLCAIKVTFILKMGQDSAFILEFKARIFSFLQLLSAEKNTFFLIWE